MKLHCQADTPWLFQLAVQKPVGRYQEAVPWSQAAHQASHLGQVSRHTAAAPINQ
jgi:hypothetical protein